MDEKVTLYKMECQYDDYYGELIIFNIQPIEADIITLNGEQHYMYPTEKAGYVKCIKESDFETTNGVKHTQLVRHTTVYSYFADSDDKLTFLNEVLKLEKETKTKLEDLVNMTNFRISFVEKAISSNTD